MRRSVAVSCAAAVLAAATVAMAAPSAQAEHPTEAADRRLGRALQRLVEMPGGPPGVIVVVQRGTDVHIHRAGVGDVSTGQPPGRQDHMRIASASKAFSGAVALSLVSRGDLSLDDTIGRRLPNLPRHWHRITLRQLLQHTSGLPDFSQSKAFQRAVLASLDEAPPPPRLLSFVKDEKLSFDPGSQYRYSNSDNIVVALMAEAVTGRNYDDLLSAIVYEPLGLRRTSLPRGVEMPTPSIRGYDLDDEGRPEDVTEVLAGGWSWASGGIVSTPADLNRFIRGYVGGELFRGAVREQQHTFVSGGSEPPGPGTNSAGLALFRYQTSCGTVFGHTGNTLGYTQLMAASRDGQRSVTVAINLQRTHTSTGPGAAVFAALRAAEELAVCAALA